MGLLSELNFKEYDRLFEKFYTEKSPIYDDLVKYKGTNIAGRKIQNNKDLAILATIFRDDRWETFRIIYMNGDKVVSENGITSRMHNISSAKFDNETSKQMFIRHKLNMKNLDADGYYLMHNHPSKDNHKPSQGDIDTTKLFIDKLPGFKGHIITSNSGASIINRDLSINTISSGKPESIEMIDGKELLNIALEYNKEKRFTLVYLNSDAEVISIQTADNHELKNIEQFQDTLFNFKRKFGASFLYFIVYNEEQLNDTTVYISSIFDIVNAIMYLDLKNKHYKFYQKKDFTDFSKPVKGLKRAGTFKNN